MLSFRKAMWHKVLRHRILRRTLGAKVGPPGPVIQAPALIATPQPGLLSCRRWSILCTSRGLPVRARRFEGGNPMALAPAQERAIPLTAHPPLRCGLRKAERALRIPHVSVVIVNYRFWEETGRLVRQLLAAPCVRRGAAEVVVVDNHSP